MLISKGDSKNVKTPGFARSWCSCFIAVLAITCVLPGLGCGESGPKIAEVSGKIMLKGEPVAGVVVSFVPDSGEKTSGGMTESGGAFQLVYNPRTVGAIVGGHTVHVSLDGKKAKTLTGSPGSVKLTKKVEVLSSGNQFDLELEDFTVGK